MVEKLMHYIWQHGLRGCRTFRTVDGDEVEVIDAGIANLDAGPDFFNAKIRIGAACGPATWSCMCALPTGTATAMTATRPMPR